MRLFLLACCASFLLSSCKKTTVTNVVPFGEDLNGWIREIPTGSGRTLTLAFSTVKEYGCADYVIEKDFSTTGNSIHIDFTGITAPGTCLDVMMPAGTSADLGTLANASYNLIFNFGDTVVNGSLLVTADGFVATIPPQNKIRFPKPAIKKTPAHTIFGDIEFGTGMETAAEQFTDSLMAAGALPVNYLPGIYTRFEIDNNGSIMQEDMNWLRKFIYQYNGDPAILHSLQERFQTRFPNGVAINLNTSYY